MSTIAATFAYHDVTDEPRASGFQVRGAAPYTIGRAAFRSHLEAMATAYRRPALVTALVPQLVAGGPGLGRYHVKLGTTPARMAALARLEGWRTAVMVRRLKGMLREHLPGLYRRYVRYTTREALPG